MSNPKRVAALLTMAEEDLQAARALSGSLTRQARYFVQQCAEKAIKAWFEHIGQSAGREHRFELLADALPSEDLFKIRVNALAHLSAAATTQRYPTETGRLPPAPTQTEIERDLNMVARLISDIVEAIGQGRGDAG